MLGGIIKKRTIIIMLAVIATIGATIGAVVAVLGTTTTADLVLERPQKAPTSIPDPFVPNTRTPVAELAPHGVEHSAALRIETDMRSDGYAIVIDGWVKDKSLAEVRIWWLNPAKADERSPFGKGVTRWVQFGYDRLENDAWRVRMRGGKKQFEFVIEMCPEGHVAAFADVDTSTGLVEHCKVFKSNLEAKKVFGLPAGLDRVTVSCKDAQGKTHQGTLRTKKVSG